jgi:GT2 family glycosyltransferase
MTAPEPLIEIVIPNWNGRQLLERCLLSLRAQTVGSFYVTVVDNGSGDGSCEAVVNGFPEVRLLRFDYNSGFSVAVNHGIEHARAPWLLLLNNDMEVAPDCLEQLLLAVDRYPRCDFFALKMLAFHQRDRLDGAGDAVLRGGVGYRLGTQETDREYYRQDRKCFGACAGAALYSRRFFAVCGLFDPNFFAYLEDVDINLRARRLGLCCMYIAGAMVFHIGSASSGSKINPLTVRLSTRNNFLVLMKNFEALLLLRFFPAIVVYQLAWLLFCGKKGMLLPYLHGLREALPRLPRLFRQGRRFAEQERGLLPRAQFAALILAAEEEAVASIMARRTAEGKGNLLLCYYRKLFL